MRGTQVVCDARLCRWWSAKGCRSARVELVNAEFEYVEFCPLGARCASGDEQFCRTYEGRGVTDAGA